MPPLPCFFLFIFQEKSLNIYIDASSGYVVGKRMRVFTRLVQKLKGSALELEPIVPSDASQSSSKSHNLTFKPALEDTDIEVLKALRMIHRESPTRSFSLKLYPGKVDAISSRVVCQRCIVRRCIDHEPRLVAVHHAREGLQLYGCMACKDFLIRIAL